MKKIILLAIILFHSFVFSIAARTVVDIAVPQGFERTASIDGSYLAYLRSIALKENNRVEIWDGSYLPEGAYESLAVLDIPLLFKEDLEQCADFSMRLWAEYLKSRNQLDELGLYDFYGNPKPFSESKKAFRNYLHWHMTYSNSYSLKLGAKKIRLLHELQAGDMFVQNDSEESIGHVSVVVDQAANQFGQKVYLVGYSFMPAQQFHIEKASDLYGLDGWFTAEGYYQYAEVTFGSFGKPSVMRFEKLSEQIESD